MRRLGEPREADAARLAAVVASLGFNESDLRRGKPALTGERLGFLFDPSVVGAPARAVLHWMAWSRRVGAEASLVLRSSTPAELAELRRVRAEGVLLRGAELRAACRAARVSLAPPPPPSGDGGGASSAGGRGESGSQSLFEAFVASKGADEGTAQSEAARRRSDAVAESVDVLYAFAKGDEDVSTGVGRRRLLDPRAETLGGVEAQIAELVRRIAPARAFYDGLAARVAMMAEGVDAAAVAEAAARGGGAAAAAEEAAALAALRSDAERAFAAAAGMGAEEEAAVEQLAGAFSKLLDGSDDAAVGERTARLSQPVLADALAAYAKRERHFTKALGAFLKKAFDRRLTGRARGVSAAAPELLRDRLVAAAALAETPAQLAAAKANARELRRLEAATASALRHRAAAAAHAARRRGRAAALSEQGRIPHDDSATLDHLISLDAEHLASLEARFRARVAGRGARGDAAELHTLGALCAARARQACASVLVGEWHEAHAQQTRYEATQREVCDLLLQQRARHAVVAGALAAEGAALSRATALLDGTLAALKQRGAERRARLAASAERRAASQSRGAPGESPERASGGDMHAPLCATDDLARAICASLELPTAIAAMQHLTWGDVADAALEQSERFERAAEADRSARELARAHTRRVAATLDGVDALSSSSATLFDALTRGYPRSLEEEAAAAAALASPSARWAIDAGPAEGAEVDARVALSERRAVWPHAGERALHTEPLVPPPLQRILSRNAALRAEMRAMYAESKSAVAKADAEAIAAARPRGAWVADVLTLGAAFAHDPKPAALSVQGAGAGAAGSAATDEAAAAAAEAPEAAADPSNRSVRSSVRHRADGIDGTTVAEFAAEAGAEEVARLRRSVRHRASGFASESVLSPCDFEVTAALEVAQLGASTPRLERGRASGERGVSVDFGMTALQNAALFAAGEEEALVGHAREGGAAAPAAVVSASVLDVEPAAAPVARVRAPPGALVISPTLPPTEAPRSPMLSPTILTGGPSRRSVSRAPLTTVVTGGASRRSIDRGVVAQAPLPLVLEPPAPVPPGAHSGSTSAPPQLARRSFAASAARAPPKPPRPS